MIRLALFSLVLFMFLDFSGIAAAQSHKKIQTVKEFFSEISGDWKGSYSLWLRPGSPAEESEINANIRPAAGGNYFLMTYSWGRGDETHEGLFLFGGRGKDATATWGDSFHSVPKPMHCEGKLAEDGYRSILNGSYSAGDGPDWGWRTEFARRGPNSLVMEAYNITPDGLEALAVKAEMKRVDSK